MSTSSTLTFTASNWNVGADSHGHRGTGPRRGYTDTASLTHTANGGDYKDVTKLICPVTVDDDETASIVLSKNSLEPVENATGATYTVHLSHVPTVTDHGNCGSAVTTGTDLTLSGPERQQHTHLRLLDNWNTRPDGHGDGLPTTTTRSNDRETLTHTAEGGEYRRT